MTSTPIIPLSGTRPGPHGQGFGDPRRPVARTRPTAIGRELIETLEDDTGATARSAKMGMIVGVRMAGSQGRLAEKIDIGPEPLHPDGGNGICADPALQAANIGRQGTLKSLISRHE